MRYRHVRWTGLVLWIIVALAGCGGGGNRTSAIPPGALPRTPAADAAPFTMTDGAATLAVPSVGGFVSSLALPATRGAAGTQLALTSSLAPPPGFAFPTARLRRPQSTGSLTVLFYFTCTASRTVTFANLPAVSVAVPAGQTTNGRLFYYGISDPGAAGAALQFRTEGPATVAGRNVQFAASATPLTLVAKQTYIFAVYAVSAQPLLFASNAATNAITAYPLDANGNTAPVRTIAGPHTRLSAPGQIVQDAGGALYVANTGSDTVTVYAPGAAGDAAPVRTIVLPASIGSPAGLALSARGDMYVSTSNALAAAKAVVRYAPGADGTATPVNSSLTGNYPAQLTVDGDGNVYSPYRLAAHAAGGVAVYSPALSELSSIQGPVGDAGYLNKTGIAHVFGTAIDGSNRLLLAQYNTVLAFAPHASGNVPPLFVLNAPATAVFNGAAVAPDGRLFLADDASQSGGAGPAPQDEITVYAAGFKAGATPSAHIAGAATQLALPVGVTVGF